MARASGLGPEGRWFESSHPDMDLTQFQKNEKFLMLALDHRESFKKAIGDLDPIQIKSEIIETLQDQFSGLLIDFDYGLPAYKNRTIPFLLPVEKTGYAEENGERLTVLEHTVPEIKSLGAAGVKLLLYFSPILPSAKRQISTAAEILSAAREAKMPFFLELVSYDGTHATEATLRMFIENNTIPNVFKLEYPGNSESCRKITDLLGSTPWILLTRGEKFEEFKGQLTDAVQNGCRGFLAGRALWQEVGQHKNETERKDFLQNTVRKRFAEISEIVLAA